MRPDLPKGVYTCTVSRHTFHHHLITTLMDQLHMCLIMVKVEQSALTQASRSFSLSDSHKYLGCLQMAPSSLDRQTTDCDSPHDWLMSLAMDLAALCDIWRWKWHQWVPFGCFWWRCSLCPSLSGSPPAQVGVLVILATQVKILL